MHEIDQVISSANCIGCGACAFVRPDLYSMEMTLAGHWQAKRQPASVEGTAPAICPMSGNTRNETEIAASLFPDLPSDPQIGRYLETFAAHVAEGEFRTRGGSGGLISWLLAELLRRGDVDGVLHVKPVDPVANDGLLFSYAISDNEEEMSKGGKSRYYPIEMSGVLAKIRNSTRRYAVVGLPCFIKAIRLMQEQGLVAKDQTPFTVGLVCGHLKSRHFAEYLAWQKGSEPGRLATFDFRRKLMDRPASNYGFAFSEKPNGNMSPPEEFVWPMASVRGYDWGEGMFKNAACEFCDDVLAECADIAIGDAWLPDYVDDPLGTNIVVTRNAYLNRIIQEGAARGAVVLAPADVDDVIGSQSSGLKHRREGLAHRLARRQSRGQWTPKKRVTPELAPALIQRLIYDTRLRIAETSSAVYGRVREEGGPLEEFERRINPILLGYKRLNQFRRRGQRELDRLGRMFSPLRRVLSRLRQMPT